MVPYLFFDLKKSEISQLCKFKTRLGNVHAGSVFDNQLDINKTIFILFQTSFIMQIDIDGFKKILHIYLSLGILQGSRMWKCKILIKSFS